MVTFSKQPEMDTLADRIDDLYQRASLLNGPDSWARRSHLQVEMVQLFRAFADLCDGPMPYWMDDDAVASPPLEAGIFENPPSARIESGVEETPNGDPLLWVRLMS